MRLYAQGFDTEILEKDELCVILPENHSLCKHDNVPVEELEKYPFLLLKKNDISDCEEILSQFKANIRIHYETWDDYSIMAMVEKGLGISMLPKLILQRAPYNIEIRSLNVPAYRNICIAMRDKSMLSKAAKTFLTYLKYIY